MTNDPRKKVTKIFGQINKIAQKGKDYTLDYHKLIDEIVAQGDFAYLMMCLSDNYNIDTLKYRTVDDIKSKTWKLILFQTDASFISGLKRIYKANSVYQQGIEIRSDMDDYVSLAEAGHPFLEEKVTIGTWNNRIERTVYTQTATSSQISITKDNSGGTQSNGIQLELLDPMVYQIDIYKATWATFSASGTSSQTLEYIIEKNLLGEIRPVGTQSSISPAFYKTGIPMTHGGDYLITVKRRGTPGWFSPEMRQESYSYKVYVRKENLLGTIKEVEYYDPGSEYLQVNQRFAQLTGMKRTFLEVQKASLSVPITVIYDSSTKSEEKNLLERYRIAIEYLNS
jgi:hypothetical protein